MLQAGMIMKPGLLPTVITSGKRMETTSMMAMTVTLAAKAALVMVLAVVAVKVSHHHTHRSLGLANSSSDGHFANDCDKVRLDLRHVSI
jgi:hypothetical protein